MDLLAPMVILSVPVSFDPGQLLIDSPQRRGEDVTGCDNYFSG